MQNSRKQTALLKAMAKLDNVQVLAANETAPLAVSETRWQC